jgi:hypothetical protein
LLETSFSLTQRITERATKDGILFIKAFILGIRELKIYWSPMNKMLKAWLAYNWHWLLATLIFPSGILAIAIITKFEFKWAYEAVGQLLIC